MLNLAEELFLLALDDDEGWIVESALDTLRFSLAAALLANLALHDRIVIEDGRLHVFDAEPIGDELLDAVLERLDGSDKPRKVKYWLNALGFRKLPKQVAQRLVELGLLHEEDRRYFWIAPNATYPQRDAPAKYWIKNELRAAGLTLNRPERRTIVLLSLLRGCRLLGLVYTRDERKAAIKRVEELAKDEDFGAAVAQTLTDIEAATAKAAG